MPLLPTAGCAERPSPEPIPAIDEIGIWREPEVKSMAARASQLLNLAGSLDEVALVHSVLRREHGVMVDVGAHRGSSLRSFAADAWRVFAFEPDPINRKHLEERWGNAANVTIDPRAIGEVDGAVVDLYVSDVSSGISAMAPFHPSHHVGARVKTVRLDTYLADLDEVTFLKTDTEGWDLPVLRTFPWDRLKPEAVVCEFEDRKTVPLGYTSNDLAAYLQELGYKTFVSEWYPVVEYGRQHRWRSLRPLPAPLSDTDAWGNFICVEPKLEDALLTKLSRRWRVEDFLRRAAVRIAGR